MMAQRLYYNDALLREFVATVTDIREVSRAHGKTLWQVALDKTAFYPTSGGQPFDTGKLIATAKSGAELEAAILEVEEDESGEVWHSTYKPLQAGTAVRGEVDWSRRLDHMQQHTGQHLLSAAFRQVAAAETVSFHLGSLEDGIGISTIDLNVEKVSDRDLKAVERLCNEVIAENRSVKVKAVSREEAVALLTAGSLTKLPERTGDIRLIEIAEFDLNACGGTHVQSTGQIGGLAIRGTEKVRQGVRVEFCCGLRAAATAQRDFKLLKEASEMLSVGSTDLADAIRKLQAENKAAAKERHALSEELADHQAVQLAVEVPIEDGLRLVVRTFNEHDAGYVKLLASKLVAAVPRTAAVFGFAPETAPGALATVVLARSQDLEMDCGTVLKAALGRHGGKGGGSKEMAQGAVARAELDGLLEEISVQLRPKHSVVE